MSKFCDRSPCAGMLAALGRWICGNTQGQYEAVVGTFVKGDKGTTVIIQYCPFCGTRLEQLELRAAGPIKLKG